MSEDAAPSDPETTTASPEPPKKRKKKRKSAKAGARANWPAFALDFPHHPEIEALVAAFEQGNYARVREGARRLLETMGPQASPTAGDTKPSNKSSDNSEERDAVRRAAAEILRRLDPDPIAIYMLVGSVLLLAFLAIWYWTHSHVTP
jgi:hypothetical protein